MFKAMPNSDFDIKAKCKKTRQAEDLLEMIGRKWIIMIFFFYIDCETLIQNKQI